MPGTDEPSPIALRAEPRGLDAANEERVALALTLMTQFSLGADVAERGATAAAIAGALQALAGSQELAPELRRLCRRLQRIWAAVAEGERH
ncbi:MAG TPA: hypothetical protein VFM98_16110 [Ramlibacter sp.]|uniref:hypothetical protein n=1 Tax=Ramlibacter sp. TaxID=1917967 RepID=UPI002D80AD0F|nr:hypothetical protein [Ramlibacter sp.]HET8747123.1 hypothetical protein [Ramlibacter sp.]